MCFVCTLKTNPFRSLTIERKTEVIHGGRPTPALPNLTKCNVKQSFVRHFQTSLYDTHTWIAGCVDDSKLFCWPCLLFSTDSSSVWVKKGYSDLNNLHTALQRHGKTGAHIESVLTLTEFGKSRIDLALDVQLRINIEKHNAAVKKNRKILKRLINVTCFLACQELAFRGHDERVNSLNRGNYVELVHFLADYDNFTKEHLDNWTVFSGLSSDTQNDIIAGTANVLLSAMQKEISEANFIAILLDETSDVSKRSQLSTVIRYVNNSTGTVEERFIGFRNVSCDRTAQALSNHVSSIVDLELKCYF